MLSTYKLLADGLTLSIFASIVIGVTLWINPRIWLQDYPKDIQALVPPKTPREKQLANLIGIPFLMLMVGFPFISTWALKQANHLNVSFPMLFLNAFGVIWIFNLWDLLILDWLIVCTFTPKFAIIPGTEGAAGYKDYAFHFRGFLIGTVLSTVAGLIVAGIVLFL